MSLHGQQAFRAVNLSRRDQGLPPVTLPPTDTFNGGAAFLYYGWYPNGYDPSPGPPQFYINLDYSLTPPTENFFISAYGRAANTKPANLKSNARKFKYIFSMQIERYTDYEIWQQLSGTGLFFPQCFIHLYFNVGNWGSIARYQQVLGVQYNV